MVRREYETTLHGLKQVVVLVAVTNKLKYYIKYVLQLITLRELFFDRFGPNIEYIYKFDN